MFKERRLTILWRRICLKRNNKIRWFLTLLGRWKSITRRLRNFYVCLFVFFNLRKPQQIFRLHIIEKICTLYINIKCSIIALFNKLENSLCPFIPDFINGFLWVWSFLVSLGILHKQWLLGFINKQKFNHRRRYFS